MPCCADMTGHKDEGDTYRKTAQDFAARWQEMAKDGDHYKLTFDGSPETWSQKYNLVWDRILGMNLFPTNVANTEVAFYKTKQNKYGLPLDNRKDVYQTGLDGLDGHARHHARRFPRAGVATLRFRQRHAARVPLTDWFNTPDAK